jgi:hypothetical protein
MLSGVLLENFRLDNGLAEAPARKRQQCSVTPTPIRDTFGSVRYILIIEAISGTGTTELYCMTH